VGLRYGLAGVDLDLKEADLVVVLATTLLGHEAADGAAAGAWLRLGAAEISRVEEGVEQRGGSVVARWPALREQREGLRGEAPRRGRELGAVSHAEATDERRALGRTIRWAPLIVSPRTWTRGRKRKRGIKTPFLRGNVSVSLFVPASRAKQPRGPLLESTYIP
jgi:hypothetical protein